jgi:hypothetical protein
MKPVTLPSDSVFSVVVRNGTLGYIFHEECLPISELKGAVAVDGGYKFDLTELFCSCREEYGRRVRKIYGDREGRSVRIGWIFLQEDTYSDSPDFFEREVWVSFEDSDGKPIPLPLPL